MAKQVAKNFQTYGLRITKQLHDHFLEFSKSGPLTVKVGSLSATWLKVSLEKIVVIAHQNVFVLLWL